MDPPELDLPSRGPDGSLLVELRDLEERVRDQAHELVRLLRGGAPGPYGRPRSSSRARTPLVIPARPGRSGRQPRVDRQYVTEATAELVRELGEPSIVRSHGAVVNVWQLDPDGDGILAGRLSADDVKGGETAFSQLHALRELATELDLKPAYAVISLRLSGRRDFEQRDDLAIILQRLRAGHAGWVAWRSPDRIARKVLPAELYYHHMRRAQARLFISELHREVDWDDDRIYLQTLNIVSEHAARAIVRNSHNAIHSRFVLTGKGWPGSVRFGFVRDRRGWIVVDPEAWPFVEAICYGYATIDPEGRPSVRALQRHLHDLGCPMSHVLVRRILIDPIYVTGEFSNTIDGELVPGRRIEIPNPIPIEVFERNRALLAMNGGPYRRNPMGTFLLNNVLLRHARCADQTTPDGTSIVLRGRSQRPPLRSKYVHYPQATSSCRGYTIDAESLDRLVVRTLRELAGSADLQAAWMINAASDPDDQLAGRPTLTPERRATLRTRVYNLEAQRAALLRDYVTEAADGKAPDIGDVTPILTSVDHEIAALRLQLRIADDVEAHLKARSQAPPPAGLLQSLDELLTDDVPDDPDHRQRRAAFVRAALSEVIVHDTDDGVAIELRGPLIPHDSPPVALDPLSLAAGDPSAVAAGDAAAEGDSPTVNYLQPYVTLWDHSRPAWRSPLLPLEQPEQGSGPCDLDLALEAIRALDPLLPAGPTYQSTILAEWGRLARLQGYPTMPMIRGAANRAGVASMAAMWRLALGDESALRRGRDYATGRSELVLCLRWALDDGLDPGVGWSVRLTELAQQRPYVMPYVSLARKARELGTTPHELLREARSGDS